MATGASIDNDVSSPKTPDKVDRIRNDDSFKTCKTTMRSSPTTRRQLRNTPARISMMSGGKPFKEAGSSGKKFNSRRKVQRGFNETAGSDETFVMREQELMFDRDSLDCPDMRKFSSTPKNVAPPLPSVLDVSCEQVAPAQIVNSDEAMQQQHNSAHESEDAENRSEPKLQQAEPKSEQHKGIERSETKILSKASPGTKRSSPGPITKKSVKISPAKKVSPKKKEMQKTIDRPRESLRQSLTRARIIRRASKASESAPKMPPPQMPPPQMPPPSANNSSRLQINRRRLFTPKPMAWRPPSVMSTASKYLDQCNTRVTRTRSFKSTAELERDYFNSLRSF